MYLPRKQTTCVPTRAAAVAAAVLAMWSPGILHRAQAEDLKVYSPIVEEGEIAFEARGNVAIDSDPAKRGAENQHYELEYTPTSYWHTALIGVVEKEAEGNHKFTATAWENIFQLFPQGQQWLDLGLYVEYEQATQPGAPNALEWKILAEKNVGPLTFTVNPIFENEIGTNAHKSTEFKYAARAKWRLMPKLEPAIEAYGDFGEIAHPDSSRAQRHQIGPVFLGKFDLGDAGILKYEAGYLFGLTSEGSPDGAFKWLLEFERHF